MSRIALYGASPTHVGGRFDWPVPEDTGHPPDTSRTGLLRPETAEQLRVRMRDRVIWLERELKMHEAYKLELETLQRILVTLSGEKTSP